MLNNDQYEKMYLYHIISYYSYKRNENELNKAFKRLSEIEPDNLEANVYLMVNENIEYKKELNQKQVDKVLKKMEYSINAGINTMYHYWYYGKVCFLTKKYKKALVMFDRAIQEFPADPDFYTQRSLCRMVLGLAGACDDLRRAKELGATDVDNLIKENCSK